MAGAGDTAGSSLRRLSSLQHRIYNLPRRYRQQEEEEDEFICHVTKQGGSVAEWLACWTQAQKGQGSDRSCDAVG